MIILISLAIIQVILWSIISRQSYPDEGLIVTAILSLSLLTLLLISIPLSRLTVSSKIAGFDAVAETVDAARFNESIENAAIQIKIAEMNEWLARSQYAKGTIWGPWMPSSILDLEPIR